jgi:hypothetical protein
VDRGDHTNFMRLYVVFRRVKCVYTWVADRRIMYKVYVDCSKVKHRCPQVDSG